MPQLQNIHSITLVHYKDKAIPRAVKLHGFMGSEIETYLREPAAHISDNQQTLLAENDLSESSPQMLVIHHFCNPQKSKSQICTISVYLLVDTKTTKAENKIIPENINIEKRLSFYTTRELLQKETPCNFKGMDISKNILTE